MHRLAIIAVLVAASAAGARAGKKARRRGPYGPSSRVERPAEARGQASLRVRSIDLSRRVVVVELGGFPRAPAGNLFTFTDDRGRKFIATDARCEEPFPSGLRLCDLTTPEGYERHGWVGLELHLHGLLSATVAAPREELERAYEAAREVGAEPAPVAADEKKPTAPVKAPSAEDEEKEE